MTHLFFAQIVAALLAAAPSPAGDAAAPGVAAPFWRTHVPFPLRVERIEGACGSHDAATDTWTFCVSELRGGGARSLNAKKFAETTDLYLFAEVDANGDRLNGHRDPQAFLDSFQAVYAAETAQFGGASDIDGDAHLWVLVCDLGDMPGAYYDPGYTNNADVLVFDYRVDDAGQFGSHELMHDILGNYDIGEAMWVYEGTAMYAANWWGKGNGPYGDGRHMEYIGWANTTNIPLNWASYDDDLMKSMVQYEIAYLFMLYLSDRYGGPDLIGDLMRDGPSKDPAAAAAHPHGIEGVEAALARAGSPKTFAQVFDDWVAANYLNQCPVGDTAYCYTTMRQFVKPTARFQQYPAAGYGPIAAWAGQYVEFYRPGYKQGRLAITFNGDAGTSYTVRVAAHDSARAKPPMVFDLALDAASNGTYTLEDFGVEYDTVSLIVAAHAGENIYFRYSAEFTDLEPPDAGYDAGYWVYDGGWDAGLDAAVDAGPAADTAPGCGCATLGF